MMTNPNTPNSTDELREKILSVDTVFRMDKMTTKEFLPPNFYIDRLVALFQSELARIRREYETKNKSS